MSTPDNRIRFPATRIDFDDIVGTTGQDHDDYPAPGQQPRFDWMRLYLIGLLSQQASYDEPTQYRDGTAWFDLNDNCLKIRVNSAWVSIASAIKLGEDTDGDPVTLAGIYTTLKTILGYKPTASFGGRSIHDGATIIPIPTSLRSAAGSGSRPFVWVDGLLIDPRKCSYVGGAQPVSVKLTGVTIDNGQTFNVLMIAVESGYFSSEEVII